MWRVLNLLYYVSPGWQETFGGNLELWPNGLDNEPLTMPYKFNRLVVMATHNNSWHSVSPIKCDEDISRCCISNYYFSENPIKNDDDFRITIFRARPKQGLQNFLLRCDSELRMIIRKIFKKGLFDTKHRYIK